MTGDVLRRRTPVPAEATSAASAAHGTPETLAPARTRVGPRTLVRALRPRQWVKNALVLAPPAAIGALDAWPQALAALVGFCAVSAAGYLVNDVHDAAEDRAHPVKRHRPVASGEVPPRTALAVALVLLVFGLGVAGWAAPRAAAWLAAYGALTVGYSLRLRDVPGLDLAGVVGCHLLRVLGGAAATSVPPSGWLIAVVSSGALLVVAGRRLAELGEAGPAGPVRAALRAYTEARLRRLVGLAAVATFVGDLLWALLAHHAGAPAAAVASALALGGFIARYLRLLAAGRGAAPEDLVLADPALLALAAAWTLAFAGAVAG